MRRLTVLVAGPALAIACLALAAPGQEKKGKQATGKAHKVEMLDDEFKPKKLTIEVGDTVTWVNKGKKGHAAASELTVPKDLMFDTEDIEPDKSSKPIAFKKEGEIPYSCEHHSKMKGVIIVKAKAKAKPKE